MCMIVFSLARTKRKGNTNNLPLYPFPRGGPFECHPDLISISNEGNDSDASDETDLASEEANSESDTEWENLPANLVQTTDFSGPPGPLTGSMSQSTSSEDGQKSQEHATAASLVSSAAASVAALWPWKK